MDYVKRNGGEIEEGAAGKDDSKTSKVLKVENWMKQVEENKNKIIDTLETLKEKVKKYAEDLYKEGTEIIKKYRENNSTLIKIQTYLNNLSRDKYNSCTDLEGILQGEANANSELTKETDNLIETLEKKVANLTLKSSFKFKNEEYESQTYKDLITIDLINVLLPLLDQNNNIYLFTKGGIKLGTAKYKGFIDKTGRDSIKGKIKTETNFFLGELESSAQNGFGIYYIGGKNIYAGEFKNGKYEGMGTLVMEDGTVRFGVFRAGDMISDEEYEIKNYLRNKMDKEKMNFDSLAKK